MHNIFSLWQRLLAWLNDCGNPAEVNSSALFDADLPPYHPCSE